MPVTLAQLVQRVKTRLKDPEFSDDEIKGFLNDAQFEVLGESPYMFLEKIDAFIEANSGELNLPIDYQTSRRLLAVKDHQGHTLDYIGPREFFDGDRTHVWVYTVYGGRLFYRMPKDPSIVECPGEFKMKHFYLAVPKEMVDDADRPVIPTEFCEILVLGALFRAEQTRDNYDFDAIQERRYEQLVENMKLRYGPRQMDGGAKATLPFGKRTAVYGY
jgi:hypothetical protein